MTNRRPKPTGNSKIPPPPGIEAGYDAIIQYHGKYSMDELEKAGYLEEVPPKEIEDLEASAAFQILCEDDLKVKLTRKDYAKLSRLAARKKVAVETLARRWVKMGLREEWNAKRPVKR
jgi:hypothetical protein